MANTPNYNLKKVEYTEIADIPAHFNGNMDVIDSALKSQADELATKETPGGAQAKADTAEDNAKSYASGLIGTLSNLLTTAKNNIVAAVNEIFGKVEDVEDSLAAHKAESVSYYTYATRDLSLEGQQIISGFPFIPKVLIIETMVPNSVKISLGRVAQNGVYVIAKSADTGYYVVSAHAIRIMDSGADTTGATVTINQDKTVTLNWAKTGAGATGTAQIRILALSHGGE